MIDGDAGFVLRKLNRAGFSSYLVGGGVRDLYLGKSPKDFDISTDARPGQIRKLFPHSATIGRRFRLVQIFFKSGKTIEVSTLRSLSEHDLDGPEAVLAPNNTYGNLPEDAQRRDLSINSLFYEIENRTIIDYVGGVEDLDNCIIRMVGDPDKRINRDPVRMMRAIRHSSRTGFTIEEKTWKAICRNREKLVLCPPSRIRDELFKDMYGGSSRQWFNLATKTGIFTTLFPFYRDTILQAPKSQPNCQEQLETIFSIIDSLHTKEDITARKKLPMHFILALILLPWVEVHYGLSKLRLKGPGAFQLTKKLRSEIDNLLGRQLNLRRSIRQEMVTLIANLPTLVRFVRTDSCPKWLKKKNYFSNCFLFYKFHMNASNSQANQPGLISLLDSAIDLDSEHISKSQFNNKNKKPAFSSKKKGSIFGL